MNPMRTPGKSVHTTVFVLPILLLALQAAPLYGQVAPDFTQAEAMLQVLHSCHDHQASERAIEGVLSLPGTELVVQQQNISRRVTMEQYRAVLQAACAGKVAEVAPAESGVRAEKGVVGLTHDVAPSLVWGRDHISLLESWLEEIRGNQMIGSAVPLARKYLPEEVLLAPKLYVVMGGRAGAAAIEDHLYFDLLITEWRASRAVSSSLSPTEVVEFFAHETHHLGYGHILERQRASLTLTPAEGQAWDFLAATMMEGSATLLITGHEKLADLEKQPDVRPYLAKVPDLLPAMENVLRSALKGPMSNEAYGQASSPFLDMGYHATGAILLAAIEGKRGLAGVLEVMRDPRRLLSAYNDCAGASTVAFKFDPSLAEQVARIGESRPR